MPTISVIMAVYNTKEEWLKEAIESILNQTFGDFEFIIVNDGSTNNVEDVILSYKDERIIYIKQENQGAGAARNNCLNIAKGEYIAIMDSDDIALPERFQKQIDYFATHKDISVLGAWFEVFPETTIVENIPNPKYLDFLKTCYIAHPTVMYKKADVDKYNLRYNSEYKCEDYELWSRAIRYLKFDNLQEVLLKYRWHGNNLSTPTEEFVMLDKKVKQNMMDWLTANKDLQAQLYNVVFNPNNIIQEEIVAIKPKLKLSFFEKIFSIKNYDENYKLITLLGIKILLERKNKI